MMNTYRSSTSSTIRNRVSPPTDTQRDAHEIEGIALLFGTRNVSPAHGLAGDDGRSIADTADNHCAESVNGHTDDVGSHHGCTHAAHNHADIIGADPFLKIRRTSKYCAPS